MTSPKLYRVGQDGVNPNKLIIRYEITQKQIKNISKIVTESWVKNQKLDEKYYMYFS